MTHTNKPTAAGTPGQASPWRPGRVAIVFGHVASNIGDLAINRGQVRMLRQAFPGAELQAVFLNAEQSTFLHEARASLDAGGPVRCSLFKSHGEHALQYLADPARFLEDAGIADADLVVLSAGEHLFHYQHGENLRSFYWRSLPALAAKVAGKRCLIMPSTLGPFEDKGSQELARSLLDLADAWAVRDARSGPLLSAGLSLSPPPVLLDPAFFLEPPARQAPGPARTVALVMRSEDWGIRRAKAERIQPTAESVRATSAYQFAKAFGVDWLMAGAMNRLQVFVQTDADAVLAETLATDLGEAHRLDIVRPIDIEDYLRLLATADAVVASRFHAIILGLVAGTPGWGVYFDEHGHKMPGLFELLEIPGRCQRLARGNAAAVGSAVAASVVAAESGLGDRLTERLAQLREKTLAWLAAVPCQPLEAAQLVAAGRAYGRYTVELARESIRATFTHKIETAEQRAREAQQRAAQFETQEAKLTAMQSLAYGLRTRLEEQAETLAQSHRELAQAQSEAEQAQKRIETLLASEVAQIATQAALKKEVSRTRARAREDVFAERNYWTSLLSYRVGDVMVRGLARPWTLPLLPFQLFRAWRGFRADQAANGAMTATAPSMATAAAAVPTAAAAATPQPLAPAKERAAKVPAAAVPENVRVLTGLLATKVDPAISQAAMRLAESGDGKPVAPSPEQLAELRAQLADGSALALRNVFSEAQRHGDHELACAAMVRIEALLEASPDAADRAFLSSLRRAPAYQLSLLRHVEAREPVQEAVPKRICYVLHNSLPYSSGGYATRSHGVAGGLQAQGYEVVCITRPGFPVDIKPELADVELPMDEMIDGVRYQRIATPTSKGIGVPEYVAGSADELVECFRALRPEVVVAASNYRVGLMAMIAARRLGIPFVYEVRGWWELTRMSRDTDFMQTSSFVAQSMLERAVANGSDHVFTLTAPMREALLEHGADPGRVTLVPNSCDPERFVPIERDKALAEALAIPEGVIVIGYVGTFVDYEGLEDLAEACGLLARRGRDFRLLLVGNENTSGTDRGPITSQVVAAAEAAGYSDRLIMPGRVPHDEVERYYSLIDIAPFPRKPWPVCEMVSPMKPLEALAMEKAVVASDVRALAEMIQDGRTGLLFRKGDVSSLADVLQRLMDDADLRGRLGREGRAWVKADRTWNAVGAIAADIIGKIKPGHG